MKVWQWFCQLGSHKKVESAFGSVCYKEPNAKGNISPSGAECVCTRLNGSAGCQCGSTMRGRYCIWSYYRMN